MEIAVRGIVKTTSTWIDLSFVTIDMKNATPEEVDEAVQQMRDLVAAAYKSGTQGQMTINTVVIDIQSFAAISIYRH